MIKGLIICMAICIHEHMTKDIDFMTKWKQLPKEDKEYVRATITAEAAEYLNKKAFEDFGMDNRAVGMALSKLILIARDCLEKQGQSKK